VIESATLISLRILHLACGAAMTSRHLSSRIPLRFIPFPFHVVTPRPAEPGSRGCPALAVAVIAGRANFAVPPLPGGTLYFRAALGCYGGRSRYFPNFELRYHICRNVVAP
jgi:hypothetical protein